MKDVEIRNNGHVSARRRRGSLVAARIEVRLLYFSHPSIAPEYIKSTTLGVLHVMQ